MKILRFLMALTASVLLMGFAASCGDDDDNPNSGKWLLSNYEDGEYVYSFTYDSQNRIIELKEKDIEDGSEYITTYEYGADGKPSKVISTGNDKPTIYRFTYPNDSVHILLESSNNSVARKLAFNANGQMVKRFDSNYSITEYKYDKNGNMEEAVETIGNNGNVVTNKYTLGSQNSPFRNVNTPSWMLISEMYLGAAGLVNEVTRMQTTTVPQSSEDRTTDFTHQYNEYGYPARTVVKTVYSDKKERTTTIFYKYIQAK